MLTDDTWSISAASLPIFQAPKLSPISQFRSTASICDSIIRSKSNSSPQKIQLCFKSERQILGFLMRDEVKRYLVVSTKLGHQWQIDSNNMGDSRISPAGLMIRHQ